MTKIIETKADKVKIFRRGCSVERYGTVALDEGRNRLLIGGLTDGAFRDSLSLRFPDLVSAENIQVLSASELLSEDELLALQQEIDDMDRKIRIWETQEELWKANGDFHTMQQVDPDKVSAYIEALPAKLSVIREEICRLEIRKAEKQKELSDGQKKMRQAVVSVDVLAARQMECPFFLEYQESGAGWEPQYEVHFRGKAEPLTIRMRAKITQQTGEDWENTQVSLYTGTPGKSLDIPELRSAYLDFYVPAAPVNYSAPAAPRAAMMQSAAPLKAKASGGVSPDTADLPDLSAYNMVRMETASATEQTEETMTAYHLPGGRDISSGSLGNMADLRSMTVPAEYLLSAVPMLDSSVRFTAEVAVKDWKIPDGLVSVYVRDTYMGKSMVRPDKTKEKFSLPLGRDERFTVRWMQVTDLGSSALLRNQQSRKLQYRILISGTVSEPETVYIQDRIPLARNEKITITVDELSGGRVNPDTGIITWELVLEPDRPLSLTLAYTVAWPKDQKIVWPSVSGNRWTDTGGMGSGWFCPVCGARNTGELFCVSCGTARR